MATRGKSIWFIDSKCFDDVCVKLVDVWRGRFKEEVNFDVKLVMDDVDSRRVFCVGKYFSGRPPYFFPWVEISYRDKVEFPGDLEFRVDIDFLAWFFGLFSRILPSGGRLMVVYQNHPLTRRGLEMGFPPPAVPIGYAMLCAGFTWFKDWYITEGLWEGEVRLQGDKALNDDVLRMHLRKLRSELVGFLEDCSVDFYCCLGRKALRLVEELESKYS